MSNGLEQQARDEVREAIENAGLQDKYPPEDFDVNIRWRGYDPSGSIGPIDPEYTITRKSNGKQVKYPSKHGEPSPLPEAFIRHIYDGTYD